MAIIIEQNKKGISWFGAVVAVFFFLLIGVGGYYLFFAPTPAIDLVAPASFRSTVEVAKITFDPSSVVNSPQFKSLRVYTGLPSTGPLGKENPFSP